MTNNKYPGKGEIVQGISMLYRGGSGSDADGVGLLVHLVAGVGAFE